MSAPTWLRRPAPSATPSAEPTLLLPRPAHQPEVRPLFPQGGAARAASVRVAPTREEASAPHDAKHHDGAALHLASQASQRHDEARADAAARLQQALVALQAMHHDIREEARADAVELAIALVKNLVGVIDGVSVDKLLEVAGEALAAAGPRDRKSTRLNSSHSDRSRMPSSA